MRRSNGKTFGMGHCGGKNGGGRIRLDRTVNTIRDTMYFRSFTRNLSAGLQRSGILNSKRPVGRTDQVFRGGIIFSRSALISVIR